MAQLTAKGVEFVSQKEAIDTTPAGKFMLTVFDAVSALERNYLLLRQAEGIAQVKAQGKYKGRQPIQPHNLVPVPERWRKDEITAAKTIQQLGVSKSTFYRLIRRENIGK